MEQNVLKAHRIMCKKWTLLIVNLLETKNTRRFNDLLSELPGISSKTLSERLKELEGLKVIGRKVYAEVPPKVEYSLTGSGRELSKSLECLYDWALKHA